MKSLSKIKNRLNETWESFSEGWSKFGDLSRSALTRFTNPIKNNEDKEPPPKFLQQWNHNVGWSLLPIDLYEDNKAIYVRLEAPGISPDDLDIHVAGDQLTLEGNKNIKREEKRDQFYFMECAYGHFSRTIPLPCKINANKAKAFYKHGVFNIILPKSSDIKKIQIQVN